MLLRPIKKTKFIIALMIVFISVYETRSFADDEIMFQPHASIIPQKPNWKEAEFEHDTVFGGYVFSANHAGRTGSSRTSYTNDPIGPIVVLWTITRYLGEKFPERKECGKEPKYPSLIAKSKVEYDEAIEHFIKPFNTYTQCRKVLWQQFKDEETRTIYYARSANNYKPILPPYNKKHLYYKIEGIFGSLGGLPLKALTEEQRSRKEQLLPWLCVDANLAKDGKKCFRLSNNEGSFYYKIRSVIEIEKKGSVPTHQEYPVDITESPQDLNEVKGIEITDKQKEYLIKRCRKNSLDCYLGGDAPDLSAEQKAYLKATAWDIDKDEKARNALIKKSEKYRAN